MMGEKLLFIVMLGSLGLIAFAAWWNRDKIKGDLF